MMIMMMMMMTQFLPITTVTEIHTFILGSEFKYGAQVRIHVLGFTNSTGILLKCDAYTCHKYETTGKTNTTLPQIWWYSVLELKLKSRWKEIWNHVETNSIQCFPEFDGLRQPPSSFEDVFRHFVMNLSDFFWLHSHFSVHGRAHHSFPTSLAPNKSLYLASTFSASPHRGLRHSSQNQKQIQITIWWWDEVPCLPGSC